MNGTAIKTNLSNRRVTIMGLGLHGGGAAAARYCASRGAKVTVTDLRSADTLRPSVEALADLDIRFVLGEHRDEDFSNADIIVKNPAVPRNAPHLLKGIQAGARMATDISLFLEELALHSTPQNLLNIVAVTGTKGKSSTVSAIHHGLQCWGRDSFLGGNITNSPLNFVEEVCRLLDESKRVCVVLELSSFQIGDLVLVVDGENQQSGKSRFILPDISAITNLLPDHQDYYPDMESYAADKAALFSLTAAGGTAIIGDSGDWNRVFISAAQRNGLTIRRPLFSADCPRPGALPVGPLVPGQHQMKNFAVAAEALLLLGLTENQCAGALESFPGVEHRLQYIGKTGNARAYNDSAATIPEACLAAVRAFAGKKVFLICGGSRKGIDLQLIAEAIAASYRAYLLEGSGTAEVLQQLKAGSKKDSLPAAPGLYGDMASAVNKAAADIAAEAQAEEEAVLLLSPGCASFGLFLNEFDRGRQFVAAVQSLENFSP